MLDYPHYSLSKDPKFNLINDRIFWNVRENSSTRLVYGYDLTLNCHMSNQLKKEFLLTISIQYQLDKR